MILAWRSVKAASLCALAYGLVAGCGSSDDDGEAAPECPRGTETCPCYRDSTCEGGLTCFSEICVDADPSDDPSGGRTTGTTGGRGGTAGNATNGGSGEDPTPSDGGEPGGVDPTGGASEPGNGGTGGTTSEPQAGDGPGPDPSDGGEPGTSGGATSGGSGGGTATGGRDGDPTGGRPDRPMGTPTVLLLLDGSSSMFEPREELWDMAFDVLMDENGPINQLKDEIRFGFSLYRGAFAIHQETDAACADISSVDFAFDNYDAIRALYETLDDDYDITVKWETPTGHAITRATKALLDDSSDGPRYLVLITDGNPNTCATPDPQCGQDRAVYAVQEAWKQGIETFPIGLGDIISDPSSGGCEPTYQRCGPDHLQDIANAGQGQPVVEPPMQYQFSQCVMNETQGYLSSYSAEGGDAPAYSTTTPAEFASAISDVLETIVEHSQ
jgi:hypothetical protein